MVTYKDLLQFIWQFIKTQKWVFLIVFLLDTFAWSFDAILWPYILHVVIDIFTQYETDRMAAWQALKLPIAAGLSLVLFVEGSSRTMGFLMAKALPTLQRQIRVKMFDHIQHHSPHYFNERFAGSLSNKISDMAAQVELIIQELFWPIVPAVATCILGAIFFWFVNPVFAAILLGWIALHLTLCALFTKPADRYEHKHGEARSTLMGKIVDSFTNNFAVNLFYRFKYENDRMRPYQDEEYETNVNARWFVEKMRSCMSLFYFSAVILGVFGSLIYFWLHDQITTGQVVQVFTSMWSISMILWNVGSSLPTLFQSFGMAKQAYVVMKEKNDLGDKPDAKELKVSSGEIVFDRVFFQYGDQMLFKDKSVKINGGEKVGLVGFTGAGKSTFINLILRLFPLKDGKITIDGQEIASITLKSLRDQIALIPQDPVLFHRSLKDNILFGRPDATESEMIESAKLAHCHEFISHLPKGYNSKVGERGTKLSGGEKQRVAIARAILANAPILILDEATSALDSMTERYIQESLGKIMQGRTTIVIAHRLSTLSRMDRILVFDKGRIVEQGSHKELLSKNGLYTKLWNMQVGGFLPDTP